MGQGDDNEHTGEGCVCSASYRPHAVVGWGCTALMLALDAPPPPPLAAPLSPSPLLAAPCSPSPPLIASCPCSPAPLPPPCRYACL